MFVKLFYDKFDFEFSQITISFLTVKWDMLQFYSNSHLFFYSEIRNLTVAPNRPLIFFFLTAKYKTLQFIVLVKRSSLTAKYKISKTVCKWPFVKQPLVLWLPSTKLLKLFPKSHSFFDHEIQILKFSWNCP